LNLSTISCSDQFFLRAHNLSETVPGSITMTRHTNTILLGRM